MPRSKIDASPDVEAARFRMPCRQRRRSNGERNDEEERREQPEQDRTRTGMGGGGDPARADDAGDCKERDVAKAEFAP